MGFMKHNYVFIALLLLQAYVTVSNAENVDSDFSKMMAVADENSLPLVNLTTDISAVTKEEEIDGVLEIFDLKARTDGRQYFKTGCRVKYRGASSLVYDKKSFAIKPIDDNGDKVDVNIFGIREDDSWILDAMAIDRIRMRNRLCFDIWNEISKVPYETDYGSRNGTLGVFVELFINGGYHGLYCMTDKINRKLLGLKKAKEDEDDGSVTIRGVLYKGDQWTDATQLYGYDTSETVDRETWNGWELQHPDDYPCAEAWQPLMDFIDFFRLPSGMFADRYDEYINKENLIDYALLVLGMNYGDCILKNTFLSTVDISDSHQFMIMPWDMDMSLGGNYNGDYNNTMADINRIKNAMLFKALYNENIGGYRDGLSSAWAGLSRTVFSVEAVCKRMDDYAEAFVRSGAWQREYNRWNGNPVPLTEDITEELSYVKDWYARNFRHVCSLLNVGTGINAVSPTMADGQGRIYTLDGMPLTKNSRHKGVAIRNGKKFVIK